MKRLFLFSAFYILHSTFSIPPVSAQRQVDGYPLANFGLTVNASADGSMFGNVLQNTGTLGEWLIEKGSVDFSIEKGGKKYALSEFTEKKIERRFPFVRGSYAKLHSIESKLQTLAFCPLKVDNTQVPALPVIMLEMAFTNSGKATDEFNIVIDHDCDNLAIRANADLLSGKQVTIPVKIPAGGEKTFRIALAFYDSEWISAKQLGNAGEIAQLAGDNWNEFLTNTQDFENHIPKTGDAELDEYLHWYMISAVSLTRITRNDEVLTMGYAELNQRDSYWTSWLHLVLYPQLEKKMIDESIAYQQPSGKIPTCILPLIEREDDLDINAFFILRAYRYFDFYKDKEALSAWWKPLKKAMDWLISRDLRGNGVPAQESMWGDWKDVGGIEGRLYSPFAVMTYLASLNKMVEMADSLGDRGAIEKYSAAYKKGYDFLNRDTKDGGLWNGNFYCQIWKDGSVNDRLLQDQMIGVFFDVVPKERAEKIADKLNSQSLTEWGIAETTPYYPARWGYKPATYHNGAVWPWLSFMDCWVRIKMGRKEEAVSLIKRVAKADLIDSHDFSPNEHINSITGENLGFIIQGWNAGLFGLVYFGLK
ncbi:MAG: hypothetical protein LBL94_03010 [Prevotellaceae bacterium]|jgi:uncharacterized protein (DUF608 family)|nr:hypothetical protein [Prevotellaceae bacterium]